MRILSSRDVSSILSKLTGSQLKLFSDELAKALADFSAQANSSNTVQPRILQPLRTSMTTNNITTLSMPATNTQFTSVKTVTVPPGRPIQGAINLYTAFGQLIGLLNAAEVTAFRTALTSMLVLSISKWGHQSKVPAQSTASYNLVVFGSGRQAEWHIRLALKFSTIQTVTIVNRGKKRLQELEDELLKDLRHIYPEIAFNSLAQEGNSNYDEQLREALLQSDIICCTTPSRHPLFPAEYIQQKPRARFVSLIGSYKPEMQEIDTATLLSGHDRKIIVDSAEACLEEAGELIKAGILRDELIEVGELFAEPKKADAHDDVFLLAPDSANVIFKCVGMSLMDLVVSKVLLDLGKEHGIGTELTDF